MDMGVFLVQSKVMAIVFGLKERGRLPIIARLEVKLVHQLPVHQLGPFDEVSEYR